MSWPKSVVWDFVHLFRGEMIGSGIGREVYRMKGDKSKVIKVETTAQSFQNIMEWETWDALNNTKYSKWFAPCHAISPCGIVMIQTFIPDLLWDEKRMPEFLTDFKRSNYGVLDGQVVCRDYGTNILLNHGAFGSKLKRVEWQD